MDINWTSQKRKLSEIDNNDNDGNTRMTKRPRLFSPEDELIYLRKKEIHFTDGINTRSIEKIIKLMTKIINKNHDKYVDSDKKLNITYVVDSPGGSVTAILKFVDFLEMTKSKYPYVEFTSVATGLIASAGTIMCVAADHRLMTTNATAMIHELASGNSGKYTHFMSYSKYLTILHNKLVNIYLKHSNQTRENVERLLNEETWYDAEGYLELGFVDKIV